MLVRESHLIYAVDVPDGVAIAVEYNRRHCLLLFEFLYLGSQMMDLLLQIAWRRPSCRHRRVVVEHGQSTQQQNESQHPLHHLLPAVRNFVRFLWDRCFGNLAFRHEWSRAPRRGRLPSPIRFSLLREPPWRLRTRNVIFPRPARLFHGTEDDVRAISEVLIRSI